MLNVGGYCISAHFQVACRNLYRYGVLAVGPVRLTVYQVAVYIDRVGIVMTHINIIGCGVFYLIQFKVTPDPVVGVVASLPDGFHLFHITSAADRHSGFCPHAVVKVGIRPAERLYASVNLHILNARPRILVAVVAIVIVGCSHPYFLLLSHIEKMDARELYLGIILFCGYAHCQFHVLDIYTFQPVASKFKALTGLKVKRHRKELVVVILVFRKL